MPHQFRKFFGILKPNPTAIRGTRPIMHRSISVSIFFICYFGMILTNGIDASSWGLGLDSASISNFNCYKQSMSFGFVSMEKTGNKIDPRGITNTTLINARAAGFPVDVHVSIVCPTCGKSASDQLKAIYDHIAPFGFGRIWIWITPNAGVWSQDRKANRNFMDQLVASSQKLKINIGFYSGPLFWNSIFGKDYQGASSIPLLYGSYRSTPDFHDFQPFGGWTTPYAKQIFSASLYLCNTKYSFKLWKA
eukprot:TRINITY_DN3216_c0_g1_i1.p1 TRINITY_DN3216_c0_g1~~TRINITY_DN3216_c0_g1_i1.p1  ORF type:complete len:249 (-),score=41.22 TRINITY_DN3216_c0_g1_i1:54-800(-)